MIMAEYTKRNKFSYKTWSLLSLDELLYCDLLTVDGLKQRIPSIAD